MSHCNLCNFDFNSREEFAGHRSGHVRRGEIPKGQNRYIPKQKSPCPECGQEFQSVMALGGHMRVHRVAFDALKSYSSKKSRLLSELGNRCQICQNTEWMGKSIPIQIDHIDGNSDNNERENLRLLCPNCHAQTDTYAGKNVGKVGETRRKAKMRKYGSYR